MSSFCFSIVYTLNDNQFFSRGKDENQVICFFNLKMELIATNAHCLIYVLFKHAGKAIIPESFLH